MNSATSGRRLLSGQRLLLIVGGLFLLLVIWVSWRAWTIYSAYRAVTSDIAALRSTVGEGLGTLSADAIAGVGPKIDDLGRDLQRLDAATAVPLGGEALVERVPWVGPRYTAVRKVIRMGELLADAGSSAVGVAHEVVAAFQATGASLPSPPTAATWLDVLRKHRAELEQIARKIDQANTLRAGIDERLLPANVRAKLDTLDQILNRFDLSRLLGADFPAFQAALGGDRPVRYLVLFQNAAEVRPRGGFPGTIALITLERSQLQSYVFSDVYDLTTAYADQRRDAVPAP